MFVCLYICIFAYLHICIFVYLYICIFVYFYICMFDVDNITEPQQRAIAPY
jgi:hypothetical protein